MIEYNQYQQIFSTIAYSAAIIIALIFYFIFRNKSDEKKRIPLYIISILILIFEIGKQVRNATGFDYRYVFGMFTGHTSDAFDPYALPFHFCSFFIFWCIFQMVFSKNKKLCLFFDNMAFLWATFIVALIIFYPQMIWGGDITLIFENGTIIHTIYFHWLVLLYWFTDLLLRVYKFDLKKIYQGPICMLIFAALAIPAAHIFKQNFCSIYSADGWDFLLPVFEKGYVAYDGLLVIIGMVLSIVIFLGITAVEKIREKFLDSKLRIPGYFINLVLMVALLIVSIITNYTLLQPLYSVYLFGLFLLSFVPTLFTRKK